VGVNNHQPDDNLARDPRLSRLLEAAGGEEPPAALDAAILAAARREVGARPHVVDVGDSTAQAPQPVALDTRAKRNWYVPVSIAAVLVMSASLVMVVHEEKSDEIAQPPRQVNTPAKASAPTDAAVASVVKPTAKTAPDMASDVAPLASNAKQAEQSRDAAAAQPSLAEKTVVATKQSPAPVAVPAAEPSKKQRAEAAGYAADSARSDKTVMATPREPEVMGNVGVPPTVAIAPPAPTAPAEAKMPAEPFPAQASRDALERRARSESDRAGGVQSAPRQAPQDTSPPTLQAAPAAPVATAPAPRRVAPAAEMPAPALADNRALAVPTPPASAPMAAAAKPVSPPLKAMVRVPLWRGLEDQPPEKWLERLVELKRDGRVSDADELMVEFRRRFPDHPYSAR
jgi:hypothetical protein